MVRRIKLIHVILAVFAGTLLIFQNCSSNMTDQGIDNTSLSYEERLPFAYKAQPDTIAYMSCGRLKEGYDQSTYFNFRVGAYKTDKTSGLGVSSEFLKDTASFSLEERARAFANSKLSADTMLQLSIRDSMTMSVLCLESQQCPGEAQNVDNFFARNQTLDSLDITRHLTTLQAGTYQNYFSGASSKRLMEASLRFLDTDVGNRLIRNRLNNASGAENRAVLVAGYTDTPNIESRNLRGVDSAAPQKVYGVGYQLKFGVPPRFSSAENRSLLSVTEIDMLTGNPVAGADWDCSLRLMVAQPEEMLSTSPLTGRTGTLFGRVFAVPDYKGTDSVLKARMDIVRRVLRTEDWHVDLQNVNFGIPVIVPKPKDSPTYRDFCYGDRTGRPLINYFANGASCTGDPSDSCPHYVTICVRKS